MFLYFFLIATIIASPENLDVIPEIKELIEACNLEDSCVVVTPEIEKSSTETAPQEHLVVCNQTPAANTNAEAIASAGTITKQNSVIITNAIEPNMLAYKHWTGTYSPETFTITIDGTVVAQGTQHEISASQSTVQIRYDYSFMNGMRTGAKIVSYQLHESITTAQLTFSWKESCKVLLENATVIKEEVV